MSKFESLRGIPEKGMTGLETLFESVDTLNDVGMTTLWEATRNKPPVRKLVYLELACKDVTDPCCMFLMNAIPDAFRNNPTSAAPAGAAMSVVRST